MPCVRKSARFLSVAMILKFSQPQGVSGPWQSVLEQQIDSSGDDCWPLNRSLTTNPFVKASSIVSSHTETTEAPSCTSAAKRLALWLPPKFMVEKVGFPQKMHRALAMVQTSESCWIVLWLTGQIIGDEEVGVRDVWQELLQCSAKGIPVML